MPTFSLFSTCLLSGSLLAMFPGGRRLIQASPRLFRNLLLVPGRGQSTYDRRTVDLAVPAPTFFFDTHSCVKTLEKNGFSNAEAESLADLITTVITAQAEAQHKSLVNKQQLEIVTQELLSQISSVRKDMSILERSEFSNLRHDTEKLDIAMKQLETKLADEVNKLKNGLVLDVNLERSRAKEDHAKTEREVSQLSNRIGLEVARMHTEIANLQAAFEGKRLDLVKYVVATFLTSVGLMVSVGLIGIRMLT